MLPADLSVNATSFCYSAYEFIALYCFLDDLALIVVPVNHSIDCSISNPSGSATEHFIIDVCITDNEFSCRKPEDSDVFASIDESSWNVGGLCNDCVFTHLRGFFHFHEVPVLPSLREFRPKTTPPAMMVMDRIGQNAQEYEYKKIERIDQSPDSFHLPSP